MLEIKENKGQIKGKISGNPEEILLDLTHIVCFIYAEYLQNDIPLKEFASILNETLPMYLENEENDNTYEN